MTQEQRELAYLMLQVIPTLWIAYAVDSRTKGRPVIDRLTLLSALLALPHTLFPGLAMLALMGLVTSTALGTPPSSHSIYNTLLLSVLAACLQVGALSSLFLMRVFDLDGTVDHLVEKRAAARGRERAEIEKRARYKIWPRK